MHQDPSNRVSVCLDAVAHGGDLQDRAASPRPRCIAINQRLKSSNYIKKPDLCLSPVTINY
ncbi:MAG: hypothetical protein F6J90_25040 [Moorea sp. SIOASIH]|uniref:hypothetical protein n=1 Tax=Moorena sp. SIOASIH TaxID=2607817 RepID=UPI0013BB7FEB|nr:hypothetical protein [Moorena sp. SIOASIH]NEO39418.1 hypothetical protein [Moorena sp. SIOASIH]